MKDTHLAVDIVLEAIIGKSPHITDELIKKAKNNSLSLVIQDLVLYCALASVKAGDTVDVARLAKLLKYSRTEPSPFLGAADRESWEPTEEEVEHWRGVVLRNHD